MYVCYFNKVPITMNHRFTLVIHANRVQVNI